MSTCGFWAHCAFHCDLTCDHNEWCPGYPVPRASRLAAWLRRLANQVERRTTDSGRDGTAT